MSIFRTVLTLLILVTYLQNALAQSSNLLPKYGPEPKNEAQKLADTKLLNAIDELYKGDRKKAASEAVSKGWLFLRSGNNADAIRRFNQAWLIDNSNGYSLWGMAIVQGNTGSINDSLNLFAEAETLISDDIDFSVDYAKALGIIGVKTKNTTIIKDAFARFEKLHERSPQHTMNLQNWAITLFYLGNYAEAWKKLTLAEATPRYKELDPSFINALEKKMPRP